MFPIITKLNYESFRYLYQKPPRIDILEETSNPVIMLSEFVSSNGTSLACAWEVEALFNYIIS
jgi:hypothetical protein